MLYKGSYEDLIYILIGVLWVAYYIYKGVNKNKTRQTVSGKQSGKPRAKNFFETFLDEIATQDEKPMEYAPQDIETKTVAEKRDENRGDKNFSYDDYYEESNFQEGKEVYQSDTNVKEARVEEVETVRKPKQKKMQIDIRKAVIYSEILNPRYF